MQSARVNKQRMVELVQGNAVNRNVMRSRRYSQDTLGI